MERLAIALFGVALAGCSGDKNSESANQDDSKTTGPDDSDSKVGGDGCVAPGRSKCDNAGSILRGYVARDPTLDVNGWSGNLWVFLTHYWPTFGELGGDVKSSVLYENVDLEDGEPFAFEIDMCEGAYGAMWSEDACGYNLELMLDKNGNATPENRLPDDLEPAHKIENVLISCEDDSQCMGTILLDCKRGAPCFQFENKEIPECECAPETCHSDYNACN